MQGETLEDVKRWLEVGIKALFPFDAESIKLLTEASLDGHEAMRNAQEAQAQRLQHRLDLFNVKIDGEYVILDAFTISKHEYAGPNSVPTPDGSLDNERIDGWLVEVAVPLCGSRDEPPDVDVAEVGKHASAAQAAKMVIERLMLDNLSHAYQAQAEYDEFERRKKEAEEVF